MLFDEEFIDDIIEHSPPPVTSHAAVAERGPAEQERARADDTDPATRPIAGEGRGRNDMGSPA